MEITTNQYLDRFRRLREKLHARGGDCYVYAIRIIEELQDPELPITDYERRLRTTAVIKALNINIEENKNK